MLITFVFVSASAVGGVASGAPGSVPSTIGAGRVIEVRPHRVDLRVDGVVIRSMWRPDGRISLDRLRRVIGDPSWIRLRSPGVYELAAALYQAPDTHVLVAAPRVRTLRLLHQQAPYATWIRGSRAQVEFRNVVVAGSQPITGALAPPGAMRPYVAYTNGSRVTITGSTFTALGRAGHDTTGVSLLKGTSGSVTGSRFDGNRQGLTLDAPGRLTVRGVTAIASEGTGLVLNGGQGIALHQVTSSLNAGDGMELSHNGQRNRIGSLTAFRNGGAGLVARDQRQLSVTGMNVGYNAVAGVALGTSQQVNLQGFRADGEQLAVDIRHGSQAVSLSGGTITGGVTGVRTDAGAKTIALRNTRVTAAQAVGFDLSGGGLTVVSSRAAGTPIGLRLRSGTQQARITQFQAADVTTGVAVKAFATDVRLDRAIVTGARDNAVAIAGTRVAVTGLRAQGVAAGVDVYGRASSVLLDTPTIGNTALGVTATRTTSGLRLRNPRINQQLGIAIASSSPGLSVDGGTLTGARLGLDLHANSTVTGISVSATHDAVRVSSGVAVDLVSSALLSSGRGVRVADDGEARVRDSKVTGDPALSGDVTLGGQNSIPPAPIPWLGIAAAIAIGAAVLLEIVRRLREHDADRKVLAPLHVARPS